MSEKMLLPITLCFMISNFDLVRHETHCITRATQHWRRRSKSESQSLKILVAGGTYLSGAGDPLRGWRRLRWRWLAMIMGGVEGTFLRLTTTLGKVVTSYKTNDGYDELSRYWDDDERPWKNFSAGEEGGLDEAQEEVLPDDAKCVHEDNNLRHYLKSRGTYPPLMCTANTF